MNTWNNIIPGILQAGKSIGDAFIERGNQSKLQGLFDMGVKKLNDVMTPQMPQHEQAINPMSDMLNSVSESRNKTVNMQGGLESLYGSIKNILPFGEQGTPYISMLEKMYESKKPEDPDYKTSFDYNNNMMITYDNKGNIIKTNKYAADKQKQGKPNAGQYGSMTVEDALKLDPKDLESNIFYLPEQTRQELFKTNPALEKVYNDFMSPPEHKTGGFRRGSIKPKMEPTTYRQDTDKKKFEQLSGFNDVINGGQQLDPKKEDEYNALRLDLGKRYGLNDTQLAQVINKLNTQQDENGRTKVLNDLEKGDYHNDVRGSQQDVDQGRQYIQDWLKSLDEAYSKNDGSYDGYKQAFLQELGKAYEAGYLTKKEYQQLYDSYK